MATSSSILAWEIPWTEGPVRLQSMGSQESDRDLATKPPPPTLLKTCLALLHPHLSLLRALTARVWHSSDISLHYYLTSVVPLSNPMGSSTSLYFLEAVEYEPSM